MARYLIKNIPQEEGIIRIIFESISNCQRGYFGKGPAIYGFQYDSCSQECIFSVDDCFHSDYEQFFKRAFKKNYREMTKKRANVKDKRKLEISERISILDSEKLLIAHSENF